MAKWIKILFVAAAVFVAAIGGYMLGSYQSQSARYLSARMGNVVVVTDSFTGDLEVVSSTSSTIIRYGKPGPVSLPALDVKETAP